MSKPLPYPGLTPNQFTRLLAAISEADEHENGTILDQSLIRPFIDSDVFANVLNHPVPVIAIADLINQSVPLLVALEFANLGGSSVQIAWAEQGRGWYAAWKQDPFEADEMLQTILSRVWFADAGMSDSQEKAQDFIADQAFSRNWNALTDKERASVQSAWELLEHFKLTGVTPATKPAAGYAAPVEAVAGFEPADEQATAGETPEAAPSADATDQPLITSESAHETVATEPPPDPTSAPAQVAATTGSEPPPAAVDTQQAQTQPEPPISSKPESAATNLPQTAAKPAVSQPTEAARPTWVTDSRAPQATVDDGPRRALSKGFKRQTQPAPRTKTPKPIETEASEPVEAIDPSQAQAQANPAPSATMDEPEPESPPTTAQVSDESPAGQTPVTDKSRAKRGDREARRKAFTQGTTPEDLGKARSKLPSRISGRRSSSDDTGATEEYEEHNEQRSHTRRSASPRDASTRPDPSPRRRTADMRPRGPRARDRDQDNRTPRPPKNDRVSIEAEVDGVHLQIDLPVDSIDQHLIEETLNNLVNTAHKLRNSTSNENTENEVDDNDDLD